MSNTEVLTHDEVVEKVGRLAVDLREAIDARNMLCHGAQERGMRKDAYLYPESSPFSTLVHHAAIVRLERQIISVIRQRGLECMHCRKNSPLGEWFLVDRESLLKCPNQECNQLTPRPKVPLLVKFEALLRWAPVQTLGDLFAMEKK